MRHFKRTYFYIISIICILIMGIVFYQVYTSKDNASVSVNSSVIRLVCVYSGTSDYYKASLEKGLKKAAREHNIWVDFISLKQYETDKHSTELDKAIASKVDGIITNIPDSKIVSQYIEKASGCNIPVILIESDLPNSGRLSFVGTNSYAYGLTAAKLLPKSSQKIKIANFKNADIDKYNLKNLGFRNALPGGMETEMFVVNENSVIEYTNMAQSIFLEHSDINSFFCTDAESTIGVVRAMIEFNKTDSLVIGAGDTEEIVEYIKNGLLYASLVEDSYSIGYLAVNCIFNHINGENISDSINPEIIVITKDNVDKVINERKDKSYNEK